MRIRTAATNFRRKARQTLAAATLIVASASASSAVIDFEAFNDNFTLTDEVPGLAFAGGTVLTAEVGLNEFDYPPVSGTNVLAALNGTLLVEFGEQVNQFSAYFSFSDLLSLVGFDIVGKTLIDFTSPVSSNLGSSSLFSLSPPSIASILVSTADGSAFTLDDLGFSQDAVTPLPEPATLALLALGLFAGFVVRARQSR